eukprot:g3898.t1
MMDSQKDSIALLIDADNSPASKIDFIISELASHGVVNIRRAYGNWTKRGLSGWIEVLHGYAIQPMQSFDLVKGKNATDMALLIDAMDILYTKEDIKTFCLVSSDSDFTPLIQRLRADGKKVIGFGDQKTPEPFIASCTHFLYLDDGAGKDASGAGPKAGAKVESVPVRQLKGNTKLMNTLRSAVKATADEEGWAALGPVGSHITNQGPFDHRTYGFKKLSDLFSAIDLFEVKGEKMDTHTVYRVDRPLIERVVAGSDKQRFRISEDESRIRASQGHSVEIDLQLEEKHPPEWLYHGTAAKFMGAIEQEGLLRGNRQHVHLSMDRATAKKVGARHGRPVVLEVGAQAMAGHGFRFFQAENGVWLTDHVPPDYLNQRFSG